MSNLKQIGLGVMQYTQDYDERITPSEICPHPSMPQLGVCAPDMAILWPQLLQPYVKNTQIFQCPSDQSQEIAIWADRTPIEGYAMPMHTSYITNTRVTYTSLSMAALEFSSTTVLVSDGGVMGSVTAPYVTTTAKGTSWLLMDTTYPGVTDTNPDWAAPNARHLDTAAVLFADGHAKAMRTSQWYYPNTPWMDPAQGGS